jgi:hypothetical protein
VPPDGGRRQPEPSAEGGRGARAELKDQPGDLAARAALTGKTMLAGNTALTGKTALTSCPAAAAAG